MASLDRVPLDLAPQPHQIERGTAGNHGESSRARRGRIVAVPPGQQPNRPQMIAASQADGSGFVVMGRPPRLALVDGASSVAEAGEGAARHTRAWPVGDSRRRG